MDGKEGCEVEEGVGKEDGRGVEEKRERMAGSSTWANCESRIVCRVASRLGA